MKSMDCQLGYLMLAEELATEVELDQVLPDVPTSSSPGCSAVESVAKLRGVDPIMLKMHLDAMRGKQ